ncbi:MULTISPECIES: hypothetical protein [unclassified Variovorax]|uniref:hypothetical protein n=1 Tax=unclassified Variovorax TaxID=663243 RepID=UPI001160AB74|nr:MULTISPECIES: hypothetical protein [unclassified Variovorax]
MTHVVREMLRAAAHKTINIEGIRGNAFHVSYASVQARPFLQVGGPVIADHCIPLSLLVQRVLRERIADVDVLVKLAYEHSAMALVTKDEDQKLTEFRLRKSMPSDWDGKDPLARYKAIGIDVLPV